MDIGANIKAYLTSHGITQAFLVKSTGLSTGKVCDICTGRRKNIDVVAYYKICRALGVELTTFIDEV